MFTVHFTEIFVDVFKNQILTAEPCVVGHACNPSISETESGESWTQD